MTHTHDNDIGRVARFEVVVPEIANKLRNLLLGVLLRALQLYHIIFVLDAESVIAVFQVACERLTADLGVPTGTLTSITPNPFSTAQSM